MKKYEVGYKKPPAATRFKVGNREHLKRRKKSNQQEGKILRAFLSATVEYREGRKIKRGHRIEVQVKSIGAAAVRGDVGAADLLLNMRERGIELGDLRTTVLVFEYGDNLL